MQPGDTQPINSEPPNSEPHPPELDEADLEFERAMMEPQLARAGGSHPPGQLLRVPIVAIQVEYVIVDAGQKAEGVIPKSELADAAGNVPYKVGEAIDAIVKGVDPDSGLLVLSHQEARRRRAHETLDGAVKSGEPVKGRVSRVVKGGVMVDLGLPAFMPASQVDIRRVENLESLVGQEVECRVLEFDPAKRRLVVSRRALLEGERLKKRDEALSHLSVGGVVPVRVKRLTEFGAFVDVGGLDALIPRSEISWHRSARPEDYLKVDETIDAKVIEIEKETGKVTLSRRQAAADPWEQAPSRYRPGDSIQGTVVSVTNYGAFVRLEEGVDGMIHVSDMAWDSGGKRPADYVAVGQQVSASILNVDAGARRISLGLKQLTADPWADIEARFPPRCRMHGKVTGLTKYGAFVEIAPGVEGMVHVSDFSWDKKVNQPRDAVNKGDEIDVCVLEVDRERRRISLGVKQLTESPYAMYVANHRVGEMIEAEIASVTDFGVFVKLAEGVDGFIHVSQLDAGRVDSPAAAGFKPGDQVRAEISKFDSENGRVALSRKQMLKREEKKTIQNFMRSNRTSGGVNLGELLAELNLEDDLPKG